MPKEQILDRFRIFNVTGGGIGRWLTEDTDPIVFERLDRLAEDPLTKTQFNQLLVLGREAPVSDGFFKYYWLEAPAAHPYEHPEIPDFNPDVLGDRNEILSLPHLEWGLRRLYTDALLYFGNVRTAFRKLRTLTNSQLHDYFTERRFDTDAIKGRGRVLPIEQIRQDDRYLISEQACKSFGDNRNAPGDIHVALREAYEVHQVQSGGSVTFRELLSGSLPTDYSDRQGEFTFSMDDVLEETVTSRRDIDDQFAVVATKFFEIREAALTNTDYYLSMADDLDVYVATSMRNRQDFRTMSQFCSQVFNHPRLDGLELRYFDPTLSAADGHEDKGLIECLMVKCAKVLVYCAGERESYGKDAEAAMALSLGKPVIFYCDESQKSRFYREVHPLSRLIEFESGVAVGAMVTDNVNQVSLLLERLFENKMRYKLEQHPTREGYILLKEEMTDSVVRLQTNNRLLTETFWNHYHNRNSAL